MYLLIDGCKNIDADIIASTAKTGVQVLYAMPDIITKVGIDFDLGSKITGYDVIHCAIATNCLPKRVQIISMNTVGSKQIADLLRKNNYKSSNNINFTKD